MPIIGRQPPADIVVPAGEVSSRHAEIVHVGGSDFLLTDLGSTNGTYVNGARIESATVHAGDRILLGDCPFDLGQFEHLIPRLTPRPATSPVAVTFCEECGAPLPQGAAVCASCHATVKRETLAGMPVRAAAPAFAGIPNDLPLAPTARLDTNSGLPRTPVAQGPPDRRPANIASPTVVGGERTVMTAVGGTLTLTTMRVRFDGHYDFPSLFGIPLGRRTRIAISMMLDSVASCALVSRSYPIFLVAAGIAALAGIAIVGGRGTQDVGVALLAAAPIFVLLYFLTRTTALSLTSTGASSIDVTVHGAGRESIGEFIEATQKARLEFIERLGR